MEKPKVAIACQGGGSHTAFTAGALKRLIPAVTTEYELVGISGTSGGAMCATAAWYGLCNDGPDRAIEKLDGLWDDIAANDPVDRTVNTVLTNYSRLSNRGAPLPSVSPYLLPAAGRGQKQLKDLLERHIDFKRCRRLAASGDEPQLVIGTVNVTEGEFETFVDDEVTADAVLASAAVPNLFRAVEIHGHSHWDGLFSQNPPIGDLVETPVGRKPDELWVIQINPQRAEETPTGIEEIADRRNELSGNLSLNQELRYIKQVNEWVRSGMLPESSFNEITVRRLEIDRTLSSASKLDRSPAFIEMLLDLGEKQATAFLERALQER